MRSSAPSTERRSSGFTLLEVMIAATLFSVVMIVALQQVKESGDAARLSTVQADLRRTGERVMANIIKDLRSTQLVYTSARAATTSLGGAIEFAKVKGFDSTNAVPILEGNSAGASANVIGGTTVVYRYQQGSGSCKTALGGDKDTGYLQFQRGTWTSYGTSPTLSTTLTQELALPGDSDWPYTASPLTAGFEIYRVDGGAFPAGLLTASVANTFGTFNAKTKPVALRLKLVFKRSSGMSKTLKRQFAFTTVDTIVELRPDGSY